MMGRQYRLWAGGGLVCVREGGCLYQGGGGWEEDDKILGEGFLHIINVLQIINIQLFVCIRPSWKPVVNNCRS